MRKKLFKLFLLIIGLISITLLYICIGHFGQLKPEIDFLDVGQGDSSLIKLANNQIILIDGGPDNMVIRRLGETLPFYQRKIDTIIISHLHDDHITGLLEVIRRFKVGSIIYMKGAQSSPLLESLLSLAQKKNIKLMAIENEATLTYSGGCFLKLLNPLKLNIPPDPNNSLVTKLNCPLFSALFTGDDNFYVEKALLKTGQNWSANILKAAHHGSKTANSLIFLKAVKPSLFVISVGANNRFGHPNPEIIDRVEKLGIKIKRTDQDGTVRIHTPE